MGDPFPHNLYDYNSKCKGGKIHLISIGSSREGFLINFYFTFYSWKDIVGKKIIRKSKGLYV